jgi:hypothetical protein
MSFDDTAEQLRRQEIDVDEMCDRPEYVTKPEWLFTDEDESGNEDTRFRQGKGERPGLAALDATLRELVAAEHEVVVVGWTSARLFRDVGHKEHYFRRWARLGAGKVLVLTKNGLWNPRDARDRMVSTIITGGDQYYSDAVREGVFRAHDERRERGVPATGWPGFGHVRACGCRPQQTEDKTKTLRCGSPDHDRWVVQPEEAVLVREAVKRVLAGGSMTAIAREWQQGGVRTRLGGQWWQTTLLQMLQSPRLVGILVSGGKEVGRTDAIEPIIDEPTFRRLQAMFVGRVRTRALRAKQLLTGVLVCGGGCGRTVHSSASNEDVRTYTCGCCSVRADVVEAVFIEKMYERLNDQRFRVALGRNDAETIALLDELREQNMELETLKGHAGRLSVDVYVAKADALTTRISELNQLIGQTATDDAVLPWLGQVERLREAWEAMPMDEKRALLLSVVGRVKLLPARARGARPTPEAVKARLVPLDTSERSPQLVR